MIPWVKYAKFLDPYEENASKRRNNLKLFLTELPKERGLFFIESQPASRCRFWFLFAAPPLDGKHFQGKAPRALFLCPHNATLGTASVQDALWTHRLLRV